MSWLVSEVEPFGFGAVRQKCVSAVGAPLLREKRVPMLMSCLSHVSSGMMSDDDSSSVHEKPRGNLKIIKAWVTTPNLLQRELLDRIADQATKYDLVRDGEFVHQVRFVLRRQCHAYYNALHAPCIPCCIPLGWAYTTLVLLSAVLWWRADGA